MKIVFICAGNVARSQIAEALFNNIARGKHIATSAGTKVVREGSNKEGQRLRDKDINIVTAMQEVNIDVSNYVRKQLTPNMFIEADKAIVMVPSKNIPEYVNQDSKTIFWEIADPFNQDLEFTRRVRNQIEIMVNNFIKVLE